MEHIEDLPHRILAARKRIGPYVYKTPLELSPDLSQQAMGSQVYIKYESDQATGSFKVRGAFNKVLTLLESNPEIRKQGVITASSGNHGLACLRACKETGVPLKIFCRRDVDEEKKQMLMSQGAEVILHGNDCMDAEIEARRQAQESGVTYISPYNDWDVIAGQGTIGVEILESLPDVDSVFVSVGGGGLIGGIARYFKQLKPSIQVVGCQPANSDIMWKSIQAGKIVYEDSLDTLSDGTAGGIEDKSVTFELCQKYVDDWVMVTEEEIEKAIFFVMEKHHKIVEGAAGVTIAAFTKIASTLTGKKVVLLSCGSNISLNVIKKLLNTYVK